MTWLALVGMAVLVAGSVLVYQVMEDLPRRVEAETGQLPSAGDVATAKAAVMAVLAFTALLHLLGLYWLSSTRHRVVNAPAGAGGSVRAIGTVAIVLGSIGALASLVDLLRGTDEEGLLRTWDRLNEVYSALSSLTWLVFGGLLLGVATEPPAQKALARPVPV